MIDMLITGHEEGEISVYHDISHWLKAAASAPDGKPLFSPTVSVLHWHAHIGLSLTHHILFLTFYSYLFGP